MKEKFYKSESKIHCGPCSFINLINLTGSPKLEEELSSIGRLKPFHANYYTSFLRWAEKYDKVLQAYTTSTTLSKGMLDLMLRYEKVPERKIQEYTREAINNYKESNQRFSHQIKLTNNPIKTIDYLLESGCRVAVLIFDYYAHPNNPVPHWIVAFKKSGDKYYFIDQKRGIITLTKAQVEKGFALNAKNDFSTQLVAYKEELKLGVLACTHGKVSCVKKIVKQFKEVDAIVLAGDINDEEDRSKSIVAILKVLTKLNKPIYVIPGAHESPEEYHKVLKKFKLVKDCTLPKNRRITINGYDLVFLPASTSFIVGDGGRFLLYTDKRQARTFKKRLKRARKVNPGLFNGKFELFYVNDLLKLVKNPKRTILVSHVPPKFKGKNAIDRARFGIIKERFEVITPKLFDFKRKDLRKVIAGERITVFDVGILTMDAAEVFAKYGYPVKIKDENVGEEDLLKYIKKLKINKMICSHIHEAGGRTNDLKSKSIKENTWSKELFYNVGSASERKAGIFIIDKDRAMYTNISA